MSTLAQLANQLEIIAETLPEKANVACQEAATAILTDLTQVTPVDIGTALSNWQVTVDAPASVEVAAFAPSFKGRMVKGRWTHTVNPHETAQANAPQTLEAGRSIIASKTPGRPLFITNVLPYIQRLNEGSSDQAPAGFFERAVILGRSVIDKFRLFK